MFYARKCHKICDNFVGDICGAFLSHSAVVSLVGCVFELQMLVRLPKLHLSVRFRRLQSLRKRSRAVDVGGKEVNKVKKYKMRKCYI